MEMLRHQMKKFKKFKVCDSVVLAFEGVFQLLHVMLALLFALLCVSIATRCERPIWIKPYPRFVIGVYFGFEKAVAVLSDESSAGFRILREVPNRVAWSDPSLSKSPSSDVQLRFGVDSFGPYHHILPNAVFSSDSMLVQLNVSSGTIQVALVKQLIGELAKNVTSLVVAVPNWRWLEPRNYLLATQFREIEWVEEKELIHRHLELHFGKESRLFVLSVAMRHKLNAVVTVMECEAPSKYRRMSCWQQSGILLDLSLPIAIDRLKGVIAEAEVNKIDRSLLWSESSGADWVSSLLESVSGKPTEFISESVLMPILADRTRWNWEMDDGFCGTVDVARLPIGVESYEGFMGMVSEGQEEIPFASRRRFAMLVRPIRMFEGFCLFARDNRLLTELALPGNGPVEVLVSIYRNSSQEDFVMQISAIDLQSGIFANVTMVPPLIYYDETYGCSLCYLDEKPKRPAALILENQLFGAERFDLKCECSVTLAALEKAKQETFSWLAVHVNASNFVGIRSFLFNRMLKSLKRSSSCSFLEQTEYFPEFFSEIADFVLHFF
jgi:hypothetical protein